MLKLYDYPRSSACFRVRIALHVKQLNFEIIPIHLTKNGGEQFSSVYKKINPQQLVPALQDGDKIITQSMAIIEYLDDLYTENTLLPNDPFAKAYVRSLALTIASDIHPLNNLRVLNYLKNEFMISDDQKNKWYQHWIEKGLTALEEKLASNKTTGDFCFGNQLTLADLCLVPQMYNARRYACDITSYPTLTRIDAYAKQHPAIVKAWPKEEPVPA